MISITVNSQQFAVKLRSLCKVVSSKPPYAALLNISFEVLDNGRVSMYATDIELGYQTIIECQTSGVGSFLLHADRLLQLVEQFPDSDVMITHDGTNANIKCGSFHSRIPTAKADDYPSVQAVTGHVFTINGDDLNSMISFVEHAVTKDSASRYLLSGALLTLNARTILAATDAHRVSVASLALSHEQASQVIIPLKTLNALNWHAKGEMTITIGDRLLLFETTDGKLSSRMLSGKFPAYERAIPSHPHVVTFDRYALAAALRRVKLSADPTDRLVGLSIGNTALRLTSSSTDAGFSEETLPVIKISHPDVVKRVAINGDYLLDFLDVATNSVITLAFGTGDVPLLFADGTERLEVLMPIATKDT